MILLAHILIALTSIAATTYAFMRPGRTVLYGSYGLFSATLATGTYLVINGSSHILQTCLVGLFYTVGVGVGLIATQRKLAAQSTKIKE
ncbi:MAG TPA: hypothetical protein VF733_02145 [Candidatus Saccharimonadales bacterium]